MNFNDPWDCKAPPITISGQKNSLKDIWFNLDGQNDPAKAESAWQILERKYPSTEMMKQYFIEKFRDAFERLRPKIGVFSLSFVPDSELMWSHYASSHSGYMLHFQIDYAQYCANSSLKNRVTLHPVIYWDERKAWDLVNYHTNGAHLAHDLIRTKSNAWAYECELRLLNIEKFGFIETPSNWLKSIVIGINTDSKLRDKLKIIGNELDVPVLSSEMNEKEYKIDIPGLGINGNDGRTCYKEVIDSRIFELKTEV